MWKGQMLPCCRNFEEKNFLKKVVIRKSIGIYGNIRQQTTLSENKTAGKTARNPCCRMLPHSATDDGNIVRSDLTRIDIETFEDEETT